MSALCAAAQDGVPGAATLPAAGVVATGLPGALQAVLQRHPALRGKRAEVASKEQLGAAARAQRLPSLSAQVARQDDATLPASVRARQPVWTFGRIESSIAAADADIAVEQADALRVRRSLMEQTAVAYARAQGVQQRVQIAREHSLALEELHQKIQRREQGQLASVADVRLALARLIQARGQQERLQGEHDLALSELQALTLGPVAADAEVPARWTKLPSVTQVEALARTASTDLALRQRRVELAEAEAEREASAGRPTVYLQADRAVQQTGLANDTRLSLVLEGSVEGLGQVNAGRQAAALSRAQAAREDLEATGNEVRRSVQSHWLARQTQTTVLASQNQSVVELEDLLTSYQRQYEAGYKAWLDVLNMLRELTEQRLALAQARTDWLTSSLRLSALIGALDDPTP